MIDALKGRGALFVFDLDSTITRCELLPEIARSISIEVELAAMTERDMQHTGSFRDGFLQRVSMLKDVPLTRAKKIAADVPVHEEMARFIRQNASRCLILTGNLDVWIEPLIDRLGMNGRCACSHAVVDGNRVLGVRAVLDKGDVALNLPRPFVAIGDGNNDAVMLRTADFGIGFGGVHALSEEVRRAADMLVNSEADLCTILNELL